MVRLGGPICQKVDPVIIYDFKKLFISSTISKETYDFRKDTLNCIYWCGTEIRLQEVDGQSKFKGDDIHICKRPIEAQRQNALNCIYWCGREIKLQEVDGQSKLKGDDIHICKKPIEAQRRERYSFLQ